MELEKLAYVFEKDLDRLAKEITSYPSEESLWLMHEGINNCGGNLALHILGNLQHFIGAILGGTDYQRDRPAEFESKHIPCDQILSLIETTKKVVTRTICSIKDESLNRTYLQQVGFGPEDMTTLQALVILAAHLNYHLGQINYHRRLLAH